MPYGPDGLGPKLPENSNFPLHAPVEAHAVAGNPHQHRSHLINLCSTPFELGRKYDENKNVVISR